MFFNVMSPTVSRCREFAANFANVNKVCRYFCTFLTVIIIYSLKHNVIVYTASLSLRMSVFLNV